MKNVLRLWIMVLSFLSSLVFAAVCFASPLTVEISLNEKLSRSGLSVNYPFSYFFIATKITNVSDKDQKITLWGCSYEWSWIANSPLIIIGPVCCAQNVGMVVVLKPKESFSQDVYVSLSSEAKMGPLTFQMGYSSKLDQDGKFKSDKQRMSTVAWSNPITINVTSAMVYHPESETLELKSQEAQPSGKSI